MTRPSGARAIPSKPARTPPCASASGSRSRYVAAGESVACSTAYTVQGAPADIVTVVTVTIFHVMSRSDSEAFNFKSQRVGQGDENEACQGPHLQSLNEVEVPRGNLYLHSAFTTCQPDSE